jgi:transposase InsO family protein
VERFRRAVDEEFYYRNFFLTVEDMQEGLNKYIEYYNSMRSHKGINGLTPEKRLKEYDGIRII